MNSKFKQLGFIGALIGAGASLLGASLAKDGQDDTNRLSAEEAARNREFQERMSNTSYQRGISDMQAAGINPMLAYSQGGASVPTGNMATFANSGAAAANAFSSMYNSFSSNTSAKAAETQAENSAIVARSQVFKIQQEVNTSKSDEDKNRAVIGNLSAEYQNLLKTGKNLDETLSVIKQTAEKLKAEVPYVNSQTFNNGLQSYILDEQRKLTRAQTGSTEQDIRNKRVDANAAESFGEVGKTVGTLRPFLELLWNIFARGR